MSATNVVEITETVDTEQPLSKEASTALYHETARIASVEARKPSNVRRDGAAFGRATARKVHREKFAGLTPSETLDALGVE